jgi:phage host-nuclease inhibitor protein Gam
MSRIKKPTVEAPPWGQVESLLRSLGRLQAQRGEAMAALDQEIIRVRSRYAYKLDALQQGIDYRLALLEAAAVANPEQFEAKKSVEFLSGTIGFRTATPSLKTIAKWTWDRVLTYLRDHKKEEFFETSWRINKEAILADREKLGKKGLAALGVKVAQPESFYAEPKLEKSDAAAA